MIKIRVKIHNNSAKRKSRRVIPKMLSVSNRLTFITFVILTFKTLTRHAVQRRGRKTVPNCLGGEGTLCLRERRQVEVESVSRYLYDGVTGYAKKDLKSHIA